MQIAHHGLHALVEDMSVDLGGRHIRMAEQFLHDTQVRAVLQQMACKGMAQHMWTDLGGGDPGSARHHLEIAGEGLPGQVSALAVGRKQPGPLAGAGRPGLIKDWP